MSTVPLSIIGTPIGAAWDHVGAARLYLGMAAGDCSQERARQWRNNARDALRAALAALGESEA